jgi:hypothetical protein
MLQRVKALMNKTAEGLHSKGRKDVSGESPESRDFLEERFCTRWKEDSPFEWINEDLLSLHDHVGSTGSTLAEGGMYWRSNRVC